jgi:hypothetical protein
MITKELLHELFDYKDGNLYRKTNCGGMKVGDICGWITVCNGRKYKKLKINKKTVYLHHAIYIFHYGYLPKRIDHKDNNSLNNKIENLRPCTQSLNIANSEKRKTNTSGYKGVSFRSDTKKWQASLTKNYKKISLGCYKTAEEAYQAYLDGSKKHFGEFAR